MDTALTFLIQEDAVTSGFFGLLYISRRERANRCLVRLHQKMRQIDAIYLGEVEDVMVHIKSGSLQLPLQLPEVIGVESNRIPHITATVAAALTSGAGHTRQIR